MGIIYLRVTTIFNITLLFSAMGCKNSIEWHVVFGSCNNTYRNLETVQMSKNNISLLFFIFYFFNVFG